MSMPEQAGVLAAARAALKQAGTVQPKPRRERERREPDQPVPLVGLDSLVADKRVLVVDGLPALEAAKTLFGTAFICMSWAGEAAGADWRPLYGRSVDLWPKAGVAGNKSMADVVEILLPHLVHGDTELRVLLQDGQDESWDIAQALTDGWDLARIAEHIKRGNESHIRIFHGGEQPLQIGRPHDGTAAIESVNDTEKSAGERSIHAWHQELGLLRNDAGPYSTEYNAALILGKHPDFSGKLWINDFSHKLMMENEVFSRDIHAVRILMHFQQYLALHKMPLQAIERACVVVGSANTRHPVRDWLKALAWDGIDRLDTFMADAFGARQNEYSRAVGRCWLVSMVARVMEPGCQADCLVVLEGAQGVKKSSALRQLGGEWFTESHADPIHDRKEFLQGLQGRWLIEIPEMHTIAGRNSIEKIKGTISNRVDSFRVPYGHDINDFPRQCIFAGSTNADAWNPDSTGGRRFWPITCGTINIEYISAQRGQLFAEAMRRYGDDHCWWDVPEIDAKEEQEARRETDPWEVPIATYITYKSTVTLTDIMSECLDIKINDFRQGDQNRVARCLRAAGWFKIQVRTGNHRQWVYRPSRAIQQSLKEKETGEDF